MKVIDPIYSSVRVLIYYMIYNYKCTCVITSTQSPKELRNPELVNVLMDCTRDDFFTCKLGNLCQYLYMI